MDEEVIVTDKKARYRASLERVFQYAQSQGYSGFSKFDAMNSPLLKTLSLGISPIQWAMTQAVYRSPINLRSLLGVKQGINPKAMGLFALGYLVAAQTMPHHSEAFQAEAIRLLEWLESHKAGGYHGMSCGYNYIWPNLRFTAPANFPNLVVTGNVMIAFLTAFEQLGDQRYLDAARSSVNFILHDLNTLIDTDADRAISYVPGSKWIVLNNQGLAAVIMAWVAKYTNEDQLRDLARRHIHFLVKQQTDYGAWYYAYPPESSPVTHDNYHTGNVLDWILYYDRFTGDTSYREAYKRGLEFYRDHLFSADGAPKHRHNVVYPRDIHSAAQGGTTFSRAALYFDPIYLVHAERSIDWALNEMAAPDGGFYYMKDRWSTNKTRLMHWNEGLMSVGIAHTLLAINSSQKGS